MTDLSVAPDLLGILAVVLTGYFLFYKSALVLVWWPLVGWALEPLGFRVVCRDMSYGVYAIRWRPA